MTDKIMEARRAKFEEWDRKSFGSDDGDQSKDEQGDYIDSIIQQCWMAYNAALDSLCVELPTPPDPRSGGGDFDYGRTGAINECRSAIHAAGVKTR